MDRTISSCSDLRPCLLYKQPRHRAAPSGAPRGLHVVTHHRLQQQVHNAPLRTASAAAAQPSPELPAVPIPLLHRNKPTSSNNNSSGLNSSSLNSNISNSATSSKGKGRRAPAAVLLSCSISIGAMAEAAVAAGPQDPAVEGSTNVHSSAASAVHSVLGTSLPLSQINKVKMHISGSCKMGISFWPMFSFTPPQREQEQAGSAKLVNAADLPADLAAAAAACPDSPAATGSSGGSSCCCRSNSSSDEIGAGTAGTAGADTGGVLPRNSQLLHVNFTRDPPDEFTVGAKFLGGIPFPFISIRTTRLEGTIDPASGAVVLMFEAQFLAAMGKSQPTCLPINSTLTSEPAAAYSVRLEGRRLDNGSVTLVSAAEVPKTGSWFADLILWLPTAATAVLPMRLEFLE